MKVSMGARVIGVILLAATIGLASCQALLTGPLEEAAGAIGGETPAETEG